MLIELPKLNPDGEQFEGEEPAELLDLQENDTIKAEGPVSYDFFVQLVGHELVVQGRISVELAVVCGRCAEIYSTNLVISDFLRASEIQAGQESVDLTADIREELLLHLPHYPVCASDCKGLCPQCGHNLNDGPCGCTAPRGDLRWSGLNDLKLK
jgi:uncharacterized protein